MNIVLFIDGSPLLLTGIKRNANNRIIHGHVINGLWELRLTDTDLYAFEYIQENNGKTEMRLHNECKYTQYEEIIVDDAGDYNCIINKAIEIRNSSSK